MVQRWKQSIEVYCAEWNRSWWTCRLLWSLRLNDSAFIDQPQSRQMCVCVLHGGSIAGRSLPLSGNMIVYRPAVKQWAGLCTLHTQRWLYCVTRCLRLPYRSMRLVVNIVRECPQSSYLEWINSSVSESPWGHLEQVCGPRERYVWHRNKGSAFIFTFSHLSFLAP